jgi:hypothetical protein
MVLMMHKNKRLKHDGSSWGREYIRRRAIHEDNKLMLNYFVEDAVYLESYFCRRFRMSLDLSKHIAECVKLHDCFFEQRRSCAGVP